MTFKKISISKTWLLFSLFFFMSIISVLASVIMDQKLYETQRNNDELVILRASFSHTRKELIDVKRTIILNAKKFDFKKNPNIILVKHE